MRPLPIRTVGVRGTARFKQAAGVPPNVQLGVTQTVCADAGATAANVPTATKRNSGIRKYERDMLLLLQHKTGIVRI
jgi:hypothetical protein